MESNTKQNIIIGLLIVIIIMMFNQNIRLRRETEQLRYSISDIENQFVMSANHISDSVRYQIENALEQESNYVSDYNVIYNGLDTKQEVVHAMVQFVVKETLPGSETYVSILKKTGEQGNDYICETTNGVNYTCDVDLSYRQDYTINMYQKAGEGSVRKLNTQEYSCYTKRDFDGRLTVDATRFTPQSDEVEYNLQLFNNTFGEKALEVKEVVAKLYGGDAVVYEEDITNKALDYSQMTEKMKVLIASGEWLEMRNISIASGEMSQVDFDFGDYTDRIRTDSNGEQQGLYVFTVNPKELDSKTDVKDYYAYELKVLITLNNGEVIERVIEH